MAANFGENTEVEVGNKIGRPLRFDLNKLGEELLEWSLLHDSLNLMQFSSKNGFTVGKLSLWANKHEGFRDALDLAKERIGINRFKAVSTGLITQVSFQKVEGNYDPLHHKYYRDEKKYESDLKKLEDKEERQQFAQELSNFIKFQSAIKE